MIKKSFDCFTVYEEADNNVFIHIEMKGGIVFLTKEADRGPPSPIRTQSPAFFYTLSVKKPVIRT